MLRAGFTVTLDPGAELDLRGGRPAARERGQSQIGSVAPARFRIWVAGSQIVVFDDDPPVGAMIHAAGAQVTASSGLELSGAPVREDGERGGARQPSLRSGRLSSGASCGEPAATAVP